MFKFLLYLSSGEELRKKGQRERERERERGDRVDVINQLTSGP